MCLLNDLLGTRFKRDSTRDFSYKNLHKLLKEIIAQVNKYTQTRTPSTGEGPNIPPYNAKRSLSVCLSQKISLYLFM